MRTLDELRKTLQQIDGHGYKAYKGLRGQYHGPHTPLSLYIDHVQGDPFAAPSRLRVRLSQERAGFPEHLFATAARCRALCTFLTSAFANAIAAHNSPIGGSGKSGLIEIDVPGQQILERSCLSVDREAVEARFFVGLPAAGRRILGGPASQLLCETLPAIVEASLLYGANDAEAIERYANTCEDAVLLRAGLADRGLVAFVGDGSVLPRRSGIDDRPLVNEGVVPFRSPPSLQVTFDLPHAGAISGMGIPAGVTLIAGGGFHGKSTLLNAIELGVYDHVPGDGRELVVTDDTAVVIRAEDGRHVAGVDLTPFIRHLPFGQTTDFFSTDNASGSTSQAAAIIEALEAGSHCLLIDEDTAATNFMIRDGRMQQLISHTNEPITPYIDRVRQLFEECGVSTILVTGGSGDYFAVADTVIAMQEYEPADVTVRAHDIARAHPGGRHQQAVGSFGELTDRVPSRRSIEPRKGTRRQSVRSRGLATISLGKEDIDLSAVAQLVHPSQTRAIAAALIYVWQHSMADGQPLRALLDGIDTVIDEAGLDALSEDLPCDFAGFRRFELAAAFNRLRSLDVEPLSANQQSGDTT